jgi:hypothetical protein
LKIEDSPRLCSGSFNVVHRRELMLMDELIQELTAIKNRIEALRRHL